MQGLELGLSFYVDLIPSGFTDAAGTVVIDASIREYILNAYFSWDSHPVVTHAELYYLHHRGDDTNTATTLFGAFGELGYACYAFMLYSRVEYLKRDTADLFFNASGSAIKAFELRVGLRWSLAAPAVIKLEFQHEFEASLIQGTLQAAFGF